MLMMLTFEYAESVFTWFLEPQVTVNNLEYKQICILVTCYRLVHFFIPAVTLSETSKKQAQH